MFENTGMKKKDDFVWAYKYAPNKIIDLILLDKHTNRFNKIIQSRNLPDTLLYGPPGVGKTTIVDVLINEIGFDVLRINGSLDTSIEVIKGDVRTFTKRGADRPKLVFIDEIERMSNGQAAAQNSLKAEIELCKKTSFIFTTNHIEKIVPALKSRCGGGIGFFYNNDEKKEIQKKYYKRAIEILELENVEFEPKAIAKIIQAVFPDMRNIIHRMQEIHNQYDKIELKAVESFLLTDLKEFYALIKKKNFNDIRLFCANLNSDYDMFYGNIIRTIEKYVEPDSISSVIDSCYEHMKTSSSCVDKELALVHFCMTLFNTNLK